jgi:CHAD domain-containing protein
MNRYISGLAKTATIENVHRFRTNSRRVEALMSDLAPKTGNSKKLLKLLSRLRKKAGKLRDLDVQIAFLKELKVYQRQDHRRQLLNALKLEHERRGRKLAKSFDRAGIEELRKRLRRAKNDMNFDGIDPLQLAFNRLPRLGNTVLNEKMLHACRIQAKQARYLAELAGNSPEAKTFVEELKQAQDAIGEWHDVLKLKERAESMFGGVHDSPLVAALQNITRAKFRRASSSLLNALSAIAAIQTARIDIVTAHRRPESEVSAHPAVA